MEDIHILLLNLFEVCENKHSGSPTLFINDCSPISSFIPKLGEIQCCKRSEHNAIEHLRGS